MGRPPSAGLVRPKNDSMARAGPWWPMAVLDLRVGLAGKPPPALYCPSVDRLGIEAHFPAASRDRPSCRDHVAGGLALEFVGVPGGRIGHVCCLSSSRCILDDLPSGMRVRNDDTGPCPAAPGGCSYSFVNWAMLFSRLNRDMLTPGLSADGLQSVRSASTRRRRAPCPA